MTSECAPGCEQEEQADGLGAQRRGAGGPPRGLRAVHKLAGGNMKQEMASGQVLALYLGVVLGPNPSPRAPYNQPPFYPTC